VSVNAGDMVMPHQMKCDTGQVLVGVVVV